MEETSLSSAIVGQIQRVARHINEFTVERGPDGAPLLVRWTAPKAIEGYRGTAYAKRDGPYIKQRGGDHAVDCALLLALHYQEWEKISGR